MNKIKKNTLIIISLLLLSLLSFHYFGIGEFIVVDIGNGPIESDIGKFFGGLAGLLITGVTLFCVALLLVVIFSGLGIIVVGLGVVTFLLVAIAILPVLGPVLIPLALILLYTIFRKKKSFKEEIKSS